MFICAFCHNPSRAGEKLTLVAVETRPKAYIASGTEIFGTEIVHEEPQCPRCAGRLDLEMPLPKPRATALPIEIEDRSNLDLPPMAVAAAS